MQDNGDYNSRSTSWRIIRRLGVAWVGWILCGIVMAGGDSLAAAGETSATLSGRLLREVLAEFRARGVSVLYSDALVHAGLRVDVEPTGATPREILLALLSPHGLSVHDGPDGTFLVVPGQLPKPRPDPGWTLLGRVVETRSQQAVPGVEVFLEGHGRAVADAAGGFELSGRQAGVYRLEASKLGFARQSLEVRIGPGQLLEVSVNLLALPATLDEIEVVPLLEVGSIHSGTLLHRQELARVPTARDPWSMVTRTPGILIDRINVGGSESGSQGLFLAPASSVEENIFSLDGVNTTDMAALGFSAIYYEFDQFEELRISTGGSDVKTTTAGVAIQMVTKRGTEVLRGSGRVLSTDADGLFGLLAQGSSSVREELAPGQFAIGQGNQVDQIFDYGVELGGPLIYDRLWAWGSLGVNDIDLLTVGGFDDDTLLENAALKINSQPRTSTSLVLAINRGAKSKDDRGAGPSRAPETTWKQRSPTWVNKFEISQVLASAALLRGEYNEVDGGLTLIPAAGVGAEGGEALLDDDGIWKNGYFGGSSNRDSEAFEIEGSLLFDRGQWTHALDVGGTSRQFRYNDDLRWSGPRQVYFLACLNTGTCGAGEESDLAYFERRNLAEVDLDFFAFWAQDAISAGRWTFSGGLRMDFQDGRNLPGEVAAHPVVPEVLPAVVYAGEQSVFDWFSWSPRLAASWRLDEAGKSLLRFSYARFAEQLGVSDVGRVNPLETALALYSFRDLNEDHIWQADEQLQFIAPFGYDPQAPTVSSNRTDPALSPEITDELLVGIEQSWSPRWIFGVNLTFRRVSDIQEIRTLVRDADGVRPVTAADYELEQTVGVPLPDGRVRITEFYTLQAGLVPTGGGLLVNGDRSRDYMGVTFSFNRRPSERWMMRGHVNWGEAIWNIPQSFHSLSDPTDVAGIGDNDDDLYAAQARGLRTDVFLQSTWTAHWSGYWQVASERWWGFTAAASVFAREGYPLPYLSRLVSQVDGLDRKAQVTEGISEFRLDDILTVDLSVEKEFRLQKNFRRSGPSAQPLKVQVSLAVFNLLNENYVLQRERNLTSPRANHLEETLAPRIVRLGFRLTW